MYIYIIVLPVLSNMLSAIITVWERKVLNSLEHLPGFGTVYNFMYVYV